MSPSPELAKAERELAVARQSFNTARNDLNTILSRLGAREGATDRLIFHADEFGVDHTLLTLSKTPEVFNFKAGIPDTEWPAVRAHLEAAYDGVHQVDLAMAKVENLARKTDPSHTKAIVIADKTYLFDARTDTLSDRDTAEVIKADARVVYTEEDGGPQRKLDQERDR